MLTRIERLLLTACILITLTEGVCYVIGQIQMGLPILYR